MRSTSSRILPALAPAALPLLLALACRPAHTPSPLMPAPPPVQARPARLDTERIEKAALRDQWAEITIYTRQAQLNGLSPGDAVLADWWTGVAEFNRGRKAQAAESWRLALGRNPDQDMTARLRSALATCGAAATPSSGGAVLEPAKPPSVARDQARPPAAAATPRPPDHAGRPYAIEVGVFAMRKPADELFRDLSWKGWDAKVTENGPENARTYTVWLGPFPAETARERLRTLERQGYGARVIPGGAP